MLGISFLAEAAAPGIQLLPSILGGIFVGIAVCIIAAHQHKEEDR